MSTLSLFTELKPNLQNVSVSNCTVPHISNGGYIGKLPGMISPGATLRYTCNNKGSYVPLFGPEVTCLTGQYFHPSPPICVGKSLPQIGDKFTHKRLVMKCFN